MRNISYFCIVKDNKVMLKNIFLLVILLFAWPATSKAENFGETDSTQQRPKISLITCGPGKEVYSLYGHTAIRVEAPQSIGDIVFNYGMFSFHQPFFILRFVFGLTDYQMAAIPTPAFIAEYSEEGRWVVEQQLNLTPHETDQIINALIRNWQQEGWTYRYNFFYDNCTTRARDMLVNNVDGTVVYGNNHGRKDSYRMMVHQMNGHERWARFGNDLLLGLQADFATDSIQQQFLPEHLEKAFANAEIVSEGQRRPLIIRTDTIVKASAVTADTEDQASPIFTPLACMILFAAITVAVIFIERKTKKRLWAFDAIWVTITALGGLILFAMIFSQHPTVRVNLQILLLNPLTLIYSWPMIKALRKHHTHWYLKALPVFTVLFLIGAIFQDYAEGMIVLALSLLIREIYLIKTNE